MKNSLALFCFSFFAIVSASGCKSSTESTASTLPTLGSIYTVHYTEHNGNYAEDTRYSVIQSGITFRGKSNVIQVGGVNLSNGLGADTTYYAYESNGDISRYPGPDGDTTRWITYPFGSQQTNSTTVTSGTETVKTTYAGATDGTFTINGSTLTTKNVTVTELTTDTAPLFTMTNVHHYSYSPTLHLIVSHVLDDYQSGGAPQNGHTEVLTSYNFK